MRAGQVERKQAVATLGMRLRAVRLRSGLSQRQVGDAVGVTRQTIYNIEQGDYATFVPVLVGLARVLGVSTDYLLGLSESESDEGAT